ncbi:MAG TPA: aldehyde dehydrogenase family protein, partial [Longimicrobiales bacterium]
YFEIASSENVRVPIGGRRADLGANYVEPTVFAGASAALRVAQEEIFGPVLATVRFQDEEEAIAIANRTIYGLAAGIWTRDVKRAHRVAQRLEAGTVWINTYHPLDAASPFGGYKQSGYGRELGAYALDLYTQIKSIWVDLS